jgi:hypothetical protein
MRGSGADAPRGATRAVVSSPLGIVYGHAMRRLALVLIVLAGVPARAADGLKPGWTPRALDDSTTACTEELVQGAWNNTKRDQGVDPAKPLTPEIREQLAPQIAAMKKLCACAVREGAKKYSAAEAKASPKDLDTLVADVVARGVCKLEQ